MWCWWHAYTILEQNREQQKGSTPFVASISGESHADLWIPSVVNCKKQKKKMRALALVCLEFLNKYSREKKGLANMNCFLDVWKHGCGLVWRKILTRLGSTLLGALVEKELVFPPLILSIIMLFTSIDYQLEHWWSIIQHFFKKISRDITTHSSQICPQWHFDWRSLSRILSSERTTKIISIAEERELYPFACKSDDTCSIRLIMVYFPSSDFARHNINLSIATVWWRTRSESFRQLMTYQPIVFLASQLSSRHDQSGMSTRYRKIISERFRCKSLTFLFVNQIPSTVRSTCRRRMDFPGCFKGAWASHSVSH